MDILQIILIATGLLVAAGGVALLVKTARGSGGEGMRPYVPFATIAVGLTIAYRSFADFRLLDGQDITIMLLFVVGIATLLGMQFFIVDRHKPRMDAAAAETDARARRREDEIREGDTREE
jgi:hypothetical protein